MTPPTRRQVFTYVNPSARSVHLSGDFNAWARDREALVRAADGVWRLELDLPSDCWQRYRFVVDGRGSVPDPNNPRQVMGPDRYYAGLASLLPPTIEVAAGPVVDHDAIAQLRLYAPQAQQVSLVGDFNQWRENVEPLERGSDGVWRLDRELLVPGWHQYAFVVDGEWLPDPANGRQMLWRADTANGRQLAANDGRPVSLVFVETREPVRRVLTDLRTVLDREPWHDSAARRQALMRFDDLMPYPTARGDPDVVAHHIARLAKAVDEIAATPVRSGAVVWQMYNHGYVVKTAQVTLGIDLVTCAAWYWWASVPQALVERLAARLDGLLLTHKHPDHYDRNLSGLLLAAGKPIWAPHDAVAPGETPLHAGDRIRQGPVEITAYLADHGPYTNLWHLYYGLRTPDGVTILHTGDHNYLRGLPDLDQLDLLLVKSTRVDPAYTASQAVRLAVEQLRPRQAIAGHLCELAHAPGHGRELYRTAYEAFEDAPSQGIVLGWGERIAVPAS